MQEYTMSNAIQKNIKIPPIAYAYNGAEKLTIKRDITYCLKNGIDQTLVYHSGGNLIENNAADIWRVTLLNITKFQNLQA